jgi:hypothetical protein
MLGHRLQYRVCASHDIYLTLQTYGPLYFLYSIGLGAVRMQNGPLYPSAVDTFLTTKKQFAI